MHVITPLSKYDDIVCVRVCANAQTTSFSISSVIEIKPYHLLIETRYLIVNVKLIY